MVSTNGLATATVTSNMTSGSQTQTILNGEAPVHPSFDPARIPSTLRLRGGPAHDRRVTWGSDVIDNEGMGKKKSKVCCIYHPNRQFGESSDESSDSSSDDSDSSGDDGRARRAGARKRKCNHAHDHGRKADGSSDRRKHGKRQPNAYEKMPKAPIKPMTASK